MKELKIEARTEQLPQVLAFVDGALEEAGCGMKAQMQIDVSVEEIFVNIAHYAYAPETGEVMIRLLLDEEERLFTIIFTDRGIPFDPLQRSEPDVTLKAEEREIGGLGILMVKKSMDEVLYSYEDGQNILTLKKRIS